MTISASAWALTLMLSFSNPERLAQLPTVKGAEESASARRARYALIADDAATVAFDAGEAPLFAGADARYRTLAALLAIAFHESGFRRDVDLGPRCASGSCDEDRRGRQHATCLMQLEIGEQGNRTAEGWSRADLLADRKRCFRSALHLLRAYAARCRLAGEWLNGYASGRCTLSTSASAGLRRSVDAFWSAGAGSLRAGPRSAFTAPAEPGPALPRPEGESAR